jgi:acetyl-CoA carboxylase carboxyl transferase subunit beta
VLEQNLKIKLPPGTSRSEFQQDHGMVDMVTHRRDLRATVSKLVTFLSPAAIREPETADTVASF